MNTLIHKLQKKNSFKKTITFFKRNEILLKAVHNKNKNFRIKINKKK